MVTTCLVVLLAAAMAVASGTDTIPPPETLVPAMLVFGDSSVDVGNNNYIPNAIFKANYPPYGLDLGNRATGRFSDGKLVVDFTAESLGFSTSPAPYLSPEATGQRLTSGANFASAGCGYWDETAKKYNAISLTQQLEYFKEYRLKLARVAGKKKTAEILSKAVYLLSVGNGDLVQNYYINPPLKKTYTLDGFQTLLISNMARFVKDLYALGARRIGITSMPAMGCFPATRNHYGQGTEGCVAWLNRDAKVFISRQRAEVSSLAKEHPNLKIGVLDIYQPLEELATNFTVHGKFAFSSVSFMNTEFMQFNKGCLGW